MELLKMNVNIYGSSILFLSPKFLVFRISPIFAADN